MNCADGVVPPEDGGEQLFLPMGNSATGYSDTTRQDESTNFTSMHDAITGQSPSNFNAGNIFLNGGGVAAAAMGGGILLEGAGESISTSRRGYAGRKHFV